MALMMDTPQVEGLFPSRVGRSTTKVAVEHELVSRDVVDGSVPRIERVAAATVGAQYAPYLAFEPGGQVELSFPTAASPGELEALVRRDLTSLRADCTRVGVELEAVAVDPRGVHAVPLQLDRPRYLAMQDRFDEVGPAGRRMMRLTASTQVCLDWASGAAGLEQWRLAQLAGPYLAAAFSTSTQLDSRLAIWLEVDPTRTAFDGRLLGTDPVAAYADFAAGAARFTSEAEHLSTLFPPVRPRGHYLEVRYLDVQPDHLIGRVVSVLANLLHDADRRRAALALLAGPERQAERWHEAAYAPHLLADRGRELMRIAGARTRVGAA
ncbi:glutamate--cysteine ligase [Aeromicrobium panaciterrae]|uniref:glutamate--cysteine ligase n=1 Tax=Aeromicrobium panaciterrae TaxID=363861 RepID=A0ABU1UPZ9_9ACTN|nr:glutamate-cysteine ligase family protein [Aeromicrobium panaciterrae]MDR7087252.1 glutamate--cysteine ligase [Aeromicrobium panaciterrae]